MIKRFLHFQHALTEKGKPLERFRPITETLDSFLFEVKTKTKIAPHIRDIIDIKRWMILVVFALLPCIFVAIWNTGMQSYLYTSGNYQLMNEYRTSVHSISDYFHFALQQGRVWTIIGLGLKAFLPIVLISYVAGGICEALFAIVRKHEITEGFLVTGILYALILPPTIPYWMVAFGVIVGVILSKEVFGGSGMNIVNPALTCRAFLFFTFPGKMSGDVWVGTNPTHVRESLTKMNLEGKTTLYDAYSQATPLARFNVSPDIKRAHVDAIAASSFGKEVETHAVLMEKFNLWKDKSNASMEFAALSPSSLQEFTTAPISMGGLGLAPENYEDAYHLASLTYGMDQYSNWNLFLGNKLGCLGETSGLACLLGAFFLIWTGVGSWRTMAGMALGAFFTAFLFQIGATFIGVDGGAWNPANFVLPAYKHLLMGGLAFGMVFMATDPVSSASMPLARWIYGAFAGFVTILIRVINPAYPEGVMLGILMANVFAPLIDYYAARLYRRKRYV